MDTDDLKILLAVEPTWTVSFNGAEYVTLPARDIVLEDTTIQAGRWIRRIESIEWLRPNTVRIRGRQKFRSQVDVFTMYPGERLPSSDELRRRRRRFQSQMAAALCAHFHTKAIQRQTLYSDRRYAIGGAYPRFLIGNRAVITVDADESAPVVNGIMRAAILWAPLVRRRVTVVLPKYRSRTIVSRLRILTELQADMDWLQFDSEFGRLEPLDMNDGEPESHVQQFIDDDLDSQVSKICAVAPERLVAVADIAGRAVSIRFRGIEVARVSKDLIEYPLGMPLRPILDELGSIRRHGSTHPMARAHEERWLESNVIAQIGSLIPSVDAEHVYPQVPSFVGEERNIIDLLTITESGRLVVMEIKASADPDLPFQALDYWIAVERHRQAGDFVRKGYFRGRKLLDQPAILVLVAPLLAFHKTLSSLIQTIPKRIPLLEIGVNQGWKKEIKTLRRRGLVS